MAITVSQRATLFIVLVCLLLLGMDGWRSWNARTFELHEMNVASNNLALAAARQADDTLLETSLVLAEIVERAEYDGTGPAALARLHQVMMRRAADLRQFEVLSLYAADGTRIATSREILQKVNNSDREYFVYLRNHPGTAPHIGVPVRSRTSGRWVIPVSRRVERPDGSFGGVALAAIDVEYFTRFYDSLQIGREGAVLMALDNGTLLARRPYVENLIGADISRNDLFQAYKAHGPAGSSIVRSRLDGIVRLASYQRLAHFPVFVGAALAKDEMLASWRRDTLLHLFGVLCLSGGVVLFGARLVQQIKRRSAAEAALIRSDRELTQANRLLQNLALSYGLTGLANRRQFDASLSLALREERRTPRAWVSLIMLDVDYFKQYNDTYGHLAGDDCLRAVSQQIRQIGAQRVDDLTARYGGEEIAVLLPHTHAAAALRIAERICEGVRAMRISHAGNPSGIVTVSAGVSACRAGEGSPAELIAAADQALYTAKRNGRDCVVCVDVDALS